MKNFAIITIGILLISCSSRLGKTVYGENRTVKSAYSVSVCTKPSKRYTKAVEAAVKASFDSLKGIPSASFDASLKQTIVKLSDYSTDGLDFDLLYFRICEFSNSAGLSEEVKTDIIKKILDIWQASVLQKNSRGSAAINVNQSGGAFNPTYVTSTNQQGGITAGVLNLGIPERHLTDVDIKQLVNAIPKTAKVAVVAVLGDAEAFGYAKEVLKWLKENGYTADGVNQAVYTEPPMPKGIRKKSETEYEIIIGSNR